MFLDKSRTYKGTRLLAAGVLLAAALALWLGGSARLHAQSGTFATQAVLTDKQERYSLAPYAYVTPDHGGALTYTAVVDRHLAGLRGDAPRGDVIPLGASHKPRWILIEVENKSWNEKWMLSLGQVLNGRIGLLDKIFVYDHIGRRYAINTLAQGKNPYVRQDAMQGAAIPLTIARGKKALLVIYAVPKAGFTATINPELLTENAYRHALNDPYSGTAIVNFLTMIVIGFFAAALAFRRMWEALLFIVYYMLLFLLFHYQNAGAHTTFPSAGAVCVQLMLAIALTGIWLMKTYFGLGRADGTPFRLIILVMALSVILAGAANVLLPDDQFLKALVPGMVVWLDIVFVTLFCLAQALQGREDAYIMTFAWLCALLGATLSLLAAMSLIPASSLSVAAYWVSLLPQAALFVTAMSLRFMRQDWALKAEHEARSRENEHVAQLMQSKEYLEGQRLKKLVEHERTLMQELRDREAQQNEEMRKAREAADLANRSKSAFLAVISHEIRTPMTGIMGMVRLLLDSQLNKTQHDYAQTIQDSGEAMVALLNDILDFEKIESGKMVLEKVDFDLHRLIQGVMTLMSGHALAKGIELKSAVDPAVPRFVIGDPVRLRQVILNLAGNSIKFTSKGSVTISIGIDPATPARGDALGLRFAVQDTGVGISKEGQRSLFNPFSQADSSVTRKYGGTGLGLAISQKLIEAMGGKILIDSEEGRGSTFYFGISMRRGSAEAASNLAQNAQNPDKSQKALSILIVEDNEVNQKLLKEFTERLGHTTDKAGSGEEAIEKIKAGAFDMVLMDIELPGVSGMGATKAIRALSDPQRAALPVIALTGNVRDEDIRNCYAANMNGHLAKPVDPLRLRQMIDKVITGKLDNPVQVSSEGDGEKRYATVNQLSAAPETLSAAPTPMRIGGDKPLIAELADNFDLGDDEKDEDSFDQALTAAEGADKNSQVFDQMMLQGLRDTLAAEKFDELIESVFESADRITAELALPGIAADLKFVAAKAHELKGMAGNFGLNALSKLMADLERAGRDGRAHDVDLYLTMIKESYDQARATVAAWRAEG